MASSSRHPDWPAGLAEAFGMIWQKSCEAAEQQWEVMRSEAEAQVATAEQDKQPCRRSWMGWSPPCSPRCVNSTARRHQQELESKLQSAEQRHAQLESNCLGLSSSWSRGGSLQQARQDSDARQAELEQRHDQRLQEARRRRSGVKHWPMSGWKACVSGCTSRWKKSVKP
jgi:hypothetical protein